MRVPSYRLHKPSGKAVVTLNGRDHYLGEHGSKESRTAYKRKIAEYLSVADPSLYGVLKEGVRIVELVVAFLKCSKAKNGTSANSEYHRQRLAMKHLRGLYGDLEASGFGVLQFKALRTHVIEHASGQLSRKYVNAMMSRVVRMFAWAAGEGLISPSVVEIIQAVPGIGIGDSKKLVERPKVQPVSDELVDATLPHLSQTVADMVRVQRLIGCRPAELCKLRIADIDRSGEIWSASLSEHKNAKRGKSRTLYFGKQSQEILKKYLFGDEFVFNPKKAEELRREALHDKRVTPLSCGNKPGSNVKRKPMIQPGDCYKRASYARAIMRACDQAKIQRWSPNQLRHAAATKIRKEIGIEAASATLGHSNLKMTEHYAKQDEQLAMEVARKLG